MSHQQSRQAQNHTVLDRSLPILLDNPDNTPSRRHGISASTERLHRIHGVALIRSAWDILLPDEQQQQKPSSTMAIESPKSVSTALLSSTLKAAALFTSSTLLHRYYHNVSLQEANVWSTAMACTLLAAKLLEVPALADVRKVITIYAHLYRKRIMVIAAAAANDNTSTSTSNDNLGASLLKSDQQYSNNDIKAFIQPSGMSPAGPVYLEWKQAIENAEHLVLRALGFLLHWIPNQMPHKYLGPMLLTDAGGGDTDKNSDLGNSELADCAWDYCNDSMFLDLATRVRPHVIACAAIILAQLDLGQSIVGLVDNNEEMPWYKYVCGVAAEADVSMACNALLGFRAHAATHGSQTWVATFGFLKSLEPENGSFNDPLSFVWEIEESRWKERCSGARVT